MINHMIIIIHLVPIGRSVEIRLKSFLWNIIIEMLILLKLRNAYNLVIIGDYIGGPIIGGHTLDHQMIQSSVWPPIV